MTTHIITKDTTQNILYAIVKQTCTNAGAARNIPNFSISTTDADTGSGQIDYTSEQYANAQLAAETAAKAAKLGIRVLTNARTGKHTFSVYEGRDLTAGNYRIGLWTRDSSCGIGTLTYIRKNLNFATALTSCGI